MKVTVEKLVFGGQGLGRVNNQVVFVWGALPGETVEIKVIKKKKNFVEGVATNILVPSPDREKPIDDHYMACSPWATVSYAKENEWKKMIAEETYSRIAKIEGLDIELVAPKDAYGYRNKMEYNFTKNKFGDLALAFHNRGTHELQPLDQCALAKKDIQNASEIIVNALRINNVPLSVLKSLIIRSGDKSQTAAAIFVSDRSFAKNYPELKVIDGISGFQIYYSNPESPASTPTELISTTGKTELSCVLNGVTLKYGLLGFFQVNPPIFETALKEMGNFVNGEKVVDYFSGVGAIGLGLHGKYKSALLVEENNEAAEFAEKNIKLNEFVNVDSVRGLAEDANAEIGDKDVVILDPPRAGLHVDLVKHLLKKRPKRIIYLSCGLDTHARDINFLGALYKPVYWKLFNFFPRTPHIEGLCVLEKKA
jgi:23S rRNA (uracil1939-C5)-methyltransferase